MATEFELMVPEGSTAAPLASENPVALDRQLVVVLSDSDGLTRVGIGPTPNTEA